MAKRALIVSKEFDDQEVAAYARIFGSYNHTLITDDAELRSTAQNPNDYTCIVVVCYATKKESRINTIKFLQWLTTRLYQGRLIVATKDEAKDEGFTNAYREAQVVRKTDLFATPKKYL